uniref:Uncharacterized protein n=1 Tax=Parascaris univalens TaxID=6257 RepID=A0A914ZZT5_PARUN
MYRNANHCDRRKDSHSRKDNPSNKEKIVPQRSAPRSERLSNKLPQ